MIRLPAALALVHDPVLGRRGERVTAAVTNLDLHDIARTCRTYGLARFYVVTPVPEQQRLVGRILRHWREGYGASYNPHRAEALALVEVVATLDEAIVRWQETAGKAPLPVLTGAGRREGLSWTHCRELTAAHPLLLVFGTGWGLAPELFTQGWPVLAAIQGEGNYNHLSVRSAAAIALDRLFGIQD